MHDLGREEGTGTYFITMEYVPGEDLKSLIHRIGALPVGKAVSHRPPGLPRASRRPTAWASSTATSSPRTS